MKTILVLLCSFTIVSCTIVPFFYSGSKLMLATRNLDYNEVRQLIENGTNINEKDSNGFTPLIMAAYYGSAPIVKYLCDSGASLNEQDNNGNTALLHASYHGFADVVKVLLAYNASLEIVNKYGYNALGYAEKFYNYRIIDLLKAAGAKSMSNKES